MSDAGENVTPIGKARRLSDSIREVKNAVADQDDVVVELREAARQRLELLVEELAPVFEEIPAEQPFFDLAISSGLQPRLWIDAVAHVSMGRDRRTYRFVRDTRLGPVVLAESANMQPVADQVTRYIAERVVERERLLEGTIEPARHFAHAETDLHDDGHAGGNGRELVTGVLLVLLGMLVAAAALAVLYRDRLPELGLSF